MELPADLAALRLTNPDAPVSRHAITAHRGEQTIEVVPFVHDMADAYGRADLVVCRAGATTLAELTTLGKVAILIPYPFATDDHQRKNADVLARAGAAEVIDQRELTGARLATAILALARDADRRARMAAAARALARPQAAREIVDRALALARHPVAAEGASG